MLQSIYRAGEMILLPKFDIAQVLTAIDTKKPTFFPGTPTMYIALINDPIIDQFDLTSIKVCISGAASLLHEVQEKFENITGGRLFERSLSCYTC